MLRSMLGSSLDSLTTYDSKEHDNFYFLSTLRLGLTMASERTQTCREVPFILFSMSYPIKRDVLLYCYNTEN